MHWIASVCGSILLSTKAEKSLLSLGFSKVITLKLFFFFFWGCLNFFDFEHLTNTISLPTYNLKWMYIYLTFYLSQDFKIYLIFIISSIPHQKVSLVWVPISSTSKIYDGWIRDLRFNPRLHKKLIDILV